MPTFAELGHPSVVSATWVGLFAPAGTAQAVVDKVAQGMGRALHEPAVIDALSKQGAEAQFMGAAAFGRYADSEITRWGSVVRAAGIKLD